jgi:hypothetical protein
MIAALNRNSSALAITEMLLNRGVDVNASDKRGFTALMYAVMGPPPPPPPPPGVKGYKEAMYRLTLWLLS